MKLCALNIFSNCHIYLKSNYKQCKNRVFFLHTLDAYFIYFMSSFLISMPGSGVRTLSRYHRVLTSTIECSTLCAATLRPVRSLYSTRHQFLNGSGAECTTFNAFKLKDKNEFESLHLAYGSIGVCDIDWEWFCLQYTNNRKVILSVTKKQVFQWLLQQFQRYVFLSTSLVLLNAANSLTERTQIRLSVGVRCTISL